MVKDIAGFELFPGDPIVFSRSWLRSNSRLEYGTYRGEGKGSRLVTDREGFKVTMFGGDILKLHEDSIETLKQKLLGSTTVGLSTNLENC